MVGHLGMFVLFLESSLSEVHCTSFFAISGEPFTTLVCTSIAGVSCAQDDVEESDLVGLLGEETATAIKDLSENGSKEGEVKITVSGCGMVEWVWHGSGKWVWRGRVGVVWVEWCTVSGCGMVKWVWYSKWVWHACSDQTLDQLQAILDKGQRTLLHKAVRALYPLLESETVEQKDATSPRQRTILIRRALKESKTSGMPT